MSDAIDNQALSILSSMIAKEHTRSDIEFVRKLWKERSVAVDALVHLREWNLMHSQARDDAVIDDVVDRALAEIEE